MSKTRDAEIRATLYPDGSPAQDIAERLITFVDVAGDLLPTADSPLNNLGRELYREEVSLDRCAQIVATDPALAHRVLRAADLAALGSRKFTIPYAVMFLGLTRLRVVFGIEVLRRLAGRQLSPTWMPLWERSLFVARLVERMAAHYYPIDGTEYLAGLLHDASWPAMATFIRNEYGLIMEEPDLLYKMDREVFGTTHAALAAAMCLRSGLSWHVVEAVARHHDTTLPNERKFDGLRYNGEFLAVLLRIADAVADAYGCVPTGGGAEAETMRDVLSSPEVIWIYYFGLPIDLERMADEEWSEVGRANALFEAAEE